MRHLAALLFPAAVIGPAAPWRPTYLEVPDVPTDLSSGGRATTSGEEGSYGSRNNGIVTMERPRGSSTSVAVQALGCFLPR